MRKTHTFNFTLLIFIMLASCSITKRRYNTGFYVQFPKIEIGSKQSFKPTSHQKFASIIYSPVKQKEQLLPVDSAVNVEPIENIISNTGTKGFNVTSNKVVTTGFDGKITSLQKHQTKPIKKAPSSNKLNRKPRPISKHAVWGFLLTTILPLIAAFIMLFIVYLINLGLNIAFLETFEAVFFVIGLTFLFITTLGLNELYKAYKETGKRKPKRGRLLLYASLIPAIIYLIISIAFLFFVS